MKALIPILFVLLMASQGEAQIVSPGFRLFASGTGIGVDESFDGSHTEAKARDRAVANAQLQVIAWTDTLDQMECEYYVVYGWPTYVYTLAGTKVTCTVPWFIFWDL